MDGLCGGSVVLGDGLVELFDRDPKRCSALKTLIGAKDVAAG